MADAFASALIGTILTNLSNKALKLYGLLTGLNIELQNLSRIFTAIQAVLCDAEIKQWNRGSGGEAVKTWLRQLKDAAYDADDVLDELDIKVEMRQRQKVSSYFSLHHNPIAFRVEMARKLKSTRETLDAIYEKRPPGLHVDSIYSLEGMLEWRLTTSLVDDSEICGRMDQRKELINDLVSNSKALSVHALCGIGGLGKTTLAQLIYNDETIEIKRLTRAIIESIGGDNVSNEQELDSLQRRLRKKLDGKKFMLILDDVWDDFSDKWDRLKNAVGSGAYGSAILITTRIQQVAEKMCTDSIRHVGRLSDDDSWSLFTIHAFRMRNPEEHKRFEKFREGIVKKCGGVPLVLKVVGSLMQLKKEENEWSDVMESELWDLADEGKKILATLRLSYTHLPMRLRQCFSYCCIYPKDYVMEKSELIQLWMANEFIISSGGSKSLHKRGQEIFDELVARSFFQNVEIDYLGNTTCKMHDLLHDVATSVMEHEIHLMQPGESFDGAKKYRHISVSSDDIEKCNSKIPSLRSFILMKKDDWCTYDIKRVEWLSTQKYLRILRCDIQLLEKLSLSKHLRYLKISDSYINQLPESICSLYKLQTLDLRSCRFLGQLPEDMKNLKSLVYLDIRDCDRLQVLPAGMKEMKSLVYLNIRGCDWLQGMPPEMGQLKGMQKLSKFIVGKEDGCKIGEMKELNGLEGELSISGLCNIKSGADGKSANMMEKKKLTSLELIAETKFDGNTIDMEVLSALQPHQNLRKLLVHGYGSLKLPNWMLDLHMHLPHLVKIKLMKFLRCEKLPIPLGRLDSLKELELCNMPCLEYIGVEVYGAGEGATFPSLEKLTLDQMSSLKEWAEITTTSSTSCSSGRATLPFPRMCELSIEECPLLTQFPIIPSLQDLSISVSTATTSQLRVANFIGLKTLSVREWDKLESLPELSQQQNNTCCLETLNICSCEMLRSLPSTGLWCSASLRHLSIWSCDELLTLSGLRHLTALESLYLAYCSKLTSLSESIQYLTVLQTLTIKSCHRLSYLPDGIRSLTTLATLEITSCPVVEMRCEEETGEDWPKIAHIPSIRINW